MIYCDLVPPKIAWHPFSGFIPYLGDTGFVGDGDDDDNVDYYIIVVQIFYECSLYVRPWAKILRIKISRNPDKAFGNEVLLPPLYR